MILAQISDLHVGLRSAPFEVANRVAQRLARTVKHLCRLRPRPDALVCTGDLVNEGLPGEYVRLLQLLRPLPMPWFVLPGNHDHREHLRAALGGTGHLPRRGPLHYEVSLGPLRLIALDSLVPGRPGGRVGAQQLRWLEGRLARSRRPTVLAMHHPPFLTGIEGMDAMGLEDAAALAEVVERHPQVERIVCGHLHRPITRRFAGTVVTTCPSVAPQVALELRSGAPVSLVSEPIACQLHLWADGGLVTHTSYI